MIDTQAIRSKILYLALRGKLTNQNPLEGSGHSLIEDNNSVLSTCSDDIKKRVGKGCKPIKPEDCLFEIPETWCWERFGNLVINFDSLRQPVTKSDRKKLIGRYDYYGATGAIDRVDDYIFDGAYLMIGEDGGNFFVSRDNSFIARGRFWANNHVHVLQPIICDIVYLKRCLDAYDLPKMGLVYGIGAPKLNQAKMNSIPIPVPPLAEQQRIVERIEQAFSALDTIDTLQAQYADNLTVLKSKLIDAAIQGKLTEQLPEDGTAEELYQQIQAEKKILAQAGELYREKSIKKITPKDIPYSIPENWRWVRLGELTKVITKGSSPQWQGVNYSDADNGILFVTSENVGDGKMLFEKRKYVQRRFNEMHPSSILQRGDILTNIVGASIGRTAIFDEDVDGANTNQAVCIVRLVNKNTSAYILRYLCSKGAVQLMLGKVVDTARANLSLTAVSNLLVPLPPLAEQQRAVSKLEELLPLCDRLEKCCYGKEMSHG